METCYISLIFLLLAFLSKLFAKSWINPASIFLILWSIITFVSSLGLYGLSSVSTYYSNLIFIGGISFFIGYALIYLLGKVEKKKKVPSKYFIRYKFLEVIAVLCLLFLIYTLLKNGITINNAFDLAGTQQSLQSANGNSGIINFISLIFVTPMYTVINLTACTSVWQKDKSKLLIYEDILLVFCRIISSGGRQAMIESSIFLVVSYFYAENKSKLTLSRKIEITLLILCLFFAFIVLSSLRTNYIAKTLMLDFAIEPSMLQSWGNYAQNTGIYGLGVSSLMGFVYIPFYFLKNMGIISSLPNLLQIIYEYNQQPIINWINLSPQVYANAYVSAFWNLYLDGRMFGVILGMFFFGLIATWIYSEVRLNKNIKNICYYSLIVYCIVYTFGDLEFSKINICLAFIYLIFFLKKGEING